MLMVRVGSGSWMWVELKKVELDASFMGRAQDVENGKNVEIAIESNCTQCHFVILDASIENTYSI